MNEVQDCRLNVRRSPMRSVPSPKLGFAVSELGYNQREAQ